MKKQFNYGIDPTTPISVGYILEVGDTVSISAHDVYPMTVREIVGGQVTCNWFDDKDVFHEETYAGRDLIIHDSESN